jgi:hypothetical protein
MKHPLRILYWRWRMRHVVLLSVDFPGGSNNVPMSKEQKKAMIKILTEFSVRSMK